MKSGTIRYLLLITFLSCSFNLSAQNKIAFGNITHTDLGNSVYKPDPGADAIVLSDVSVAALNYSEDDGFWVEHVRDVKIKIVNSRGFDHANIELVYYNTDDLTNLKASTFNLKNGEIVETPVDKKSFIRDEYSSTREVLRFSFPDVHEGSIIEYNYTVDLKSGGAVNTLVPKLFQQTIPVKASSLTLVYPDYFTYKTNITGKPELVHMASSSKNQLYFGEMVDMITSTYTAVDVPAFREEPYIKSSFENLTKVQFELASVNLPNYTEEITPTYQNLTKKLMERTDFGTPITNYSFANKLVEELIAGAVSEREKFNRIYSYVTDKLIWNGQEDYTTSKALKKVISDGKGNSADLNLLLISLLRNAKFIADPVILSTRSNGSINQYSAIVSQFNYVVVLVKIDGKDYLIDATDPLRPFNLLPEECLNGSGWQAGQYNTGFVALKNSMETGSKSKVSLKMDQEGNLYGSYTEKSTGYSALDLRWLLKLEGVEGYLAGIRALSTDLEFSKSEFSNIGFPDSSITEFHEIKIRNGVQKANDKILFNPSLSFVTRKNPFYLEERTYPIDFAYPNSVSNVIEFEIPEGYSITQKPADFSVSALNGFASYSYKSEIIKNKIIVTEVFSILKPEVPVKEYKQVRDLFSMKINKESELFVLEKTN